MGNNDTKYMCMRCCMQNGISYRYRDHLSIQDNKLYCLCEQPDMGSSFVACDVCDQWFHHSCLNLAMPALPDTQSSGNSNQLIHSHLRCPRCCDDIGIPYQQFYTRLQNANVSTARNERLSVYDLGMSNSARNLNLESIASLLQEGQLLALHLPEIKYLQSYYKSRKDVLSECEKLIANLLLFIEQNISCIDRFAEAWLTPNLNSDLLLCIFTVDITNNPPLHDHCKQAVYTEQSQHKTNEENILRNYVGKKIRILWPEDQVWYTAKVIKYHSKQKSHVILYDADQMEETVLLHKMKDWKICDSPVILTEDDIAKRQELCLRTWNFLRGKSHLVEQRYFCELYLAFWCAKLVTIMQGLPKKFENVDKSSLVSTWYKWKTEVTQSVRQELPLIRMLSGNLVHSMFKKYFQNFCENVVKFE